PTADAEGVDGLLPRSGIVDADAPWAAEPTRVFGRRVEYKWVVAAVFVSALFLDVLDTTVVNVALPTIGRELQSDSVEWLGAGLHPNPPLWAPRTRLVVR